MMMGLTELGGPEGSERRVRVEGGRSGIVVDVSGGGRSVILLRYSRERFRIAFVRGC